MNLLAFISRREKLFKFLVVGALGTFVNMLFLWLCKDLIELEVWVSGIIAIETSVIFNFVLHNLWTFNKNNNIHSIHGRFIRYHLSVLLGVSINYLILIILNKQFGVNYLLSNFIGICIATISNYLLSSRWAWKGE
jgi:putative flippase GtrA